MHFLPSHSPRAYINSWSLFWYSRELSIFRKIIPSCRNYLSFFLFFCCCLITCRDPFTFENVLFPLLLRHKAKFSSNSLNIQAEIDHRISCSLLFMMNLIKSLILSLECCKIPMPFYPRKVSLQKIKWQWCHLTIEDGEAAKNVLKVEILQGNCVFRINSGFSESLYVLFFLSVCHFLLIFLFFFL